MALKATLIFCAILAMGFAVELHEDAHNKKSDKENENSFLSAPPQKSAEKEGHGVLPAASAGAGPGNEAAVKNERDARYFGFYFGSGRGYGGYGFGGGYGGYGGWGGYGGYGGYGGGGWGGRGWGGGWYGR